MKTNIQIKQMLVSKLQQRIKLREFIGKETDEDYLNHLKFELDCLQIEINLLQEIIELPKVKII